MSATLWTPDRPAPYPLAIINHASSEEAQDRLDDPTPRYRILTTWFLQHGYAVVLPIRPGHAPTGGDYLEDQYSCTDADFIDSGIATADSIEAALDYMLAQPFAQKSGAIVVGQSAGAWGAIALSRKNLPAVRAILNFSGGRGGHAGRNPNQNCAPDTLVAAAHQFGSTARVPTLWLYATNDTYFNPDLSRRMVAAYRAAGGKVDYDLLPAMRDEGHFFVQYPESTATWGPIVQKFLAQTP